MIKNSYAGSAPLDPPLNLLISVPMVASGSVHGWECAWIGLSDKVYEQAYQWDDGPFLTWTNWGPVSNHFWNDDYVKLCDDGRWKRVYAYDYPAARAFCLVEAGR